MRAIFVLSLALALACAACATADKPRPQPLMGQHGTARKAGFGAAGAFIP
jgi:hypothetical protein